MNSQGVRIMDSGGWNWAFMDIVGPAILIIVIAWAILRNRASRRSMDETERGTRDVYRAEEEARRSGDDGRA
jgi:predicted MFS family arabinose efflux permease